MTVDNAGKVCFIKGNQRTRTYFTSFLIQSKSESVRKPNPMAPKPLALICSSANAVISCHAITCSCSHLGQMGIPVIAQPIPTVQAMPCAITNITYSSSHALPTYLTVFDDSPLSDRSLDSLFALHPVDFQLQQRQLLATADPDANSRLPSASTSYTQACYMD